ncbi:cupin domain-containing protein [Tomitella fengzijianii]|uniref:Cupin domain-containing protein n=2 Tax=Tomitella fengzijianii TaxID=2597660 RepID=A0A516X226_9ACTN|nr:cupin domain-containing protein [Tomitella fengzijianii]QDQ97129.1 cupin domain-containing protein [Tomitella fengzijianii]
MDGRNDATSIPLPDWAGGLGLEQHPEGGWFRETWRSGTTLPVESLPPGYPGSRSAGTSILFLLAPGQRSTWHRVPGAELWLHHRGGAIALELGGTGDAPRDSVVRIVGTDVECGESPQVVVPEWCWQRAAPLADEAGLVGCVVVPGFDFADFRMLE